MKKIKPLAKKHRFRRWVLRLFGIKSPSKDFAALVAKKVDEMHEYPDPAIIRQARVGHWVEGDYGDCLKLACSSCGAPFEYRTNFCPDCGIKMQNEI